MSADGKWNFTVETPMGAQQREITIKTAGATFTATVDGGPAGPQQVSGTVAGDKLKWSSNITQPMPLTLQFDVSVAGDTMTGTVVLGPMGSAPVTGTRIG